MRFTIRDSVKKDMSQVMGLIKELADFENEPNAVLVTVADLEKDGFGENPLFHCFVSEVEDQIVGIALVYARYSTWKGSVVHLEDLIVKGNMRGSGIGSALLSRVVEYAHSLGVKRVSWEVLDWNEPAIKFYESKGANVMRDWNVVQLNQQGIQKFINNI